MWKRFLWQYEKAWFSFVHHSLKLQYNIRMCLTSSILLWELYFLFYTEVPCSDRSFSCADLVSKPADKSVMHIPIQHIHCVLPNINFIYVSILLFAQVIPHVTPVAVRTTKLRNVQLHSAVQFSGLNTCIHSLYLDTIFLVVDANSIFWHGCVV